MTDIVIGQCDLRIHRPAGTVPPWLDGDDHKALAQRVQAVVLPMIEELLAPRLIANAPGQGMPLSIDLKLSAHDLSGITPLARSGLRSRLAESVELALAELDAQSRRAHFSWPGQSDALAPSPLARSGLRSRLAESVEVGLAVPDAQSRRAHSSGPEQSDTLAPSLQREPAEATATSALDLAGYLVRLFHSAGANSAQALLSEQALLALLAHALERLPAQPSAADPSDARSTEDASRQFEGATRHPDRRDIIAALGALAEAFQLSRDMGNKAQWSATNLADAQALAHRVFVSATAGAPGAAASESHNKAGRPIEMDKKHTGPLAATFVDGRGLASFKPAPQLVDVQNLGQSARAPVHLESHRRGQVILQPGRYFLDHALPFLALAVLHRHGMIDALALDAPDPDVLQTLFAAIALKTLPPDAARGPGAWASSVRRTAAEAGGLEEAPDGAAFALAAGRIGNGGAYTRACLAAALLGSLHPQGALPLVAANGRVTVFDPGGLYPIAAAAPDVMAPILRNTGRTLFLSPPDPAVWAILDGAGLPAIAEGPALRDERAVAVAGSGGWRGHATGAVRLSPGIRARLPDEAATAARAADVWQALAYDAALVASAAADTRTAAMDELVALLAGFALADMGWRLACRDPASWAEPDPLLVRNRFADLSGWLEVGATRITVALPLGRRFTDLRDAGFLDTVRGSPWWPGHEIAFRGG